MPRPGHHNPIPGSEPPRRGLFIDRWGTLLELPRRGYTSTFARARFTRDAVDTLFHAGQRGWNLYLLGNEESVAFGHLSAERWQAFEQQLLEHLRLHGVPVKRCYACLDHPQGKAPHDSDSVFLLPNTGAMYHAAQVDGISLRDSWVIGDSTLELAAGWRAGCHTAAVDTGLALSDRTLQVEPDTRQADLAAVLSELMAHEHLPR